MPRSKPTTLTQPIKGNPKGTVIRHEIQTREFAVGATRTVHLYRPPVEGPVPLLFVFDGTDYLKRAKLNVIVDNLIAESHTRPFAMAMVQNGGAARTTEYSCSEATLGLLMESILPVAKENLNLEPVQDGHYGVLGASLGGLMALYAAMRLPQVFRKALSQSGAFINPEYQFVVVDLVRYAPRPEIDIWMDAGRFEWLLEGNRQMYDLLKEKNYRVKYREFFGGHNFTSWRNDLWHGLEYLYGNK
jgi:enterochelin esterase-like enzyme